VKLHQAGRAYQARSRRSGDPREPYLV